ncbi:MAG TPA: hypothetical protein VGI74_26525 [Streptosporangiaceae bacterium]
MSLPSRNEVTSLRWTATEGNTNNDGSLFTILSISLPPFLSFGAYVNPALQDPNGPWDEFYNTPANVLQTALTGPGGTWSNMAVDPKEFATAGVALNAVQVVYGRAGAVFDLLDAQLNSEASQYQGSAGAAFEQIIKNLFTNTQTIYDQMNKAPSYGGMIGQSGTDTWNFVVGLWNAMIGWINNRLDFSPIGAIFQALLDGGVIVHNGGDNYSLPHTSINDLGFYRNNPTFGDLLSDQGWQNVESAAKTLWQAAIVSDLDAVAKPLVTMLADSYLNTAAGLQPIKQPGMTQITPPNVSDNMGLNGIGDGFNGLANGLGDLGNMFGSGFNGLANGLGGLGDMFGSGFNGMANGLGGLGNMFGSGFNGMANGLGGLGNAFGSGFNGMANGLGGLGGNLNGLGGPGGLGGNLNGPGGNLNGPGGNLNVPGGNVHVPGGVPGGNLNGPGGLSNPGATSALQSALGDSQTVQQALKHALALAPSSGPLHNALESALAANTQEQNALQSALAGNTPAGTALQNALASNGQVQSSLNKALSSGQVPTTGALRHALQQARGDSTKTRQALQHALSASVPGGSSLQKALTDNGHVQSALRRALASSQVPVTGPLHHTLESALANSSKAKTALDQALAGGRTPEASSIQKALTDNKAAQAELQKALASPQIPKTGPLHNELENALANSRGVGSALHQALTSAGVPAEAGKLITSAAQPGAALGNLAAQLGGGKGLTANLSHLSAGAGGGIPGGVGGASGPAGLSGGAGLSGAGAGAGLAGGTGVAASSGKFVPLAAQTGGSSGSSGSGTSAVPFFPPMAGGGMGGMGGMGGQQGNQERERTTWLSEDEDVWGTDPSVGPGVLGRDFMDLDDVDDDSEFPEPAEQQRFPGRAQTR